MIDTDILIIIFWLLGALLTTIFCIMGMVKAVKNSDKEAFSTSFGFLLVGLSPLSILVLFAGIFTGIYYLLIKLLPDLLYYLMKKKS